MELRRPIKQAFLFLLTYSPSRPSLCLLSSKAIMFSHPFLCELYCYHFHPHPLSLILISPFPLYSSPPTPLSLSHHIFIVLFLVFMVKNFKISINLCTGFTFCCVQNFSLTSLLTLLFSTLTLYIL